MCTGKEPSLDMSVGHSFNILFIAATVTLVDSSAVGGTVAGTLSLVYESGELKISGTVTGLDAGAHGFHVHEKGLTSDDCKDAGGHFNPENVRISRLSNDFLASLKTTSNLSMMHLFGSR